LDEQWLRSSKLSADESGCTAAVALLNKHTGHLSVANVGDARIVLGHADGRCEMLTIDHKPAMPEERARIESAGHQVGDSRLDWVLAVSRALGDRSFKLKDAHLKPEFRALTAFPHASELHVPRCDGDEDDGMCGVEGEEDAHWQEMSLDDEGKDDTSIQPPNIFCLSHSWSSSWLSTGSTFSARSKFSSCWAGRWFLLQSVFAGAIESFSGAHWARSETRE